MSAPDIGHVQEEAEGVYHQVIKGKQKEEEFAHVGQQDGILHGQFP